MSLARDIQYNKPTPSYTQAREFIYDYDTPNKSFLKTAAVLKAHGVKNYKFFLKLYDPSLKGVNPHDPTLSDIMKARIRREVTINPFYFLREVVLVPAVGADVHFALHVGNLAVIWCFLNNIKSYLELPRQNYKTTSILALMLHVFNFGATNTNIMFMNKDAPQNIINLNDFKKLRDLLPEYLRHDYKLLKSGKRSKDDGNKKFLKNHMTLNTINLVGKATSIDSAKKMGRGMSQSVFFWDEVAFINYVKDVYGSAAPSYSQASAEARENGVAYGMVFASTPGDLADRDGAYVYNNIIKESGRFDFKLYDYSARDIDNFLRCNSRNTGFVYIRYSYEELGRDRAYYREQRKNMLGDMEGFRREVLLEWARGNSNSPFDTESIEVLCNSKVEPIKRETVLGYYTMNVFENVSENHPVVVGGDASAGVLSDASTFVVRSFLTGKVLSTFRSSSIAVLKYAELLEYIITKKYPRSVLALENNYVGRVILEYLDRRPCSPKLYKDDKVNLSDKKYDQYGDMVIDDVVRRKQLGILTSKDNRPKMFDDLAHLIYNKPEIFRCPELIHEISALVRKPNNKIEHPTDGHDDMVMAFNMSEILLGERRLKLAQYGLIDNRYEEAMIAEQKKRIENMSADEIFETYGIKVHDRKKTIEESVREIELNSGAIYGSADDFEQQDDMNGGLSVSSYVDMLCSDFEKKSLYEDDLFKRQW